MTNGSSRISQYSRSVPRPELGGFAVIVFTPSELSCWVSVVVGVPGMTVSYDFPFVRSPVAGVLAPLEPLEKVTVLILCALASATNCE